MPCYSAVGDWVAPLQLTLDPAPCSSAGAKGCTVRGRRLQQLIRRHASVWSLPNHSFVASDRLRNSATRCVNAA